MNLAIDLGNTTLKWGIFEDKNLIFRGKFDYLSLGEEIKFFKNFQITYVAYSSVVQIPIELTSFFSQFSFVLSIDQNCSLPIKNSYETPNSLGIDRLMNAVGASSIFENNNVLIIDCGTCLKIDFYSVRYGFEGGAIAPGIAMRYKALNYYTHQLPLLEPNQFNALTGRNTNDSIHNGVMSGIANEINGAIRTYSDKFPDIKVIITGGDYHYFQDIIEKKAIFAEPDLTLIGINLILLHNIE
ncbi:MAG: type III pantothenate kinase [Bacteroidota bacterium]|jgi:type III pantothenate kinase